jgi:xanthine dehydrogenase accessory factor
MRDLLLAARALARDGHALALAHVVAVRGSAPRLVGFAMLIASDGSFTGSVSGGCVEGIVIQEAASVLAGGPALTLDFSGDADPLTEITLGCGGSETIAIERIDAQNDLAAIWLELLAQLDRDAACTLATQISPTPAHWLFDERGTLLASDTDSDLSPDAYIQHFASAARLAIVGADAIAQAVAGHALLLGWRVTVIDPRAAWLTPQRFVGVARVVEWPDRALRAMPLDEQCAVVVLTHDPKLDEPALIAALRSRAGYIGALGSRTSQAERRIRLLAAGLSPDDLARLHAPVGLDLGGATPHEIALSILAEIVASRNGRAGGPLRQGMGPIHAIPAPGCGDEERGL